MAHDAAVFRKVVLGELIIKVCDAWAKIHQELILIDMVLYPMLTLIHEFGPLGLDGFI